MYPPNQPFNTFPVISSLTATDVLTIWHNGLCNITVEDLLAGIFTGPIHTHGASCPAIPGTALGTGPSFAYSTNPVAGRIQTTAGTACQANSMIFRVTFPATFGTTPRAMITAESPAAANAKVFAQTTATTLELWVSGTLTDAALYWWDYLIVG